MDIIDIAVSQSVINKRFRKIKSITKRSIQLFYLNDSYSAKHINNIIIGAIISRFYTIGGRDNEVNEHDIRHIDNDSLIGYNDSIIGDNDSFIGENDSLIGDNR